jgi:dolichol-phosphate mannosyltransferase
MKLRHAYDIDGLCRIASAVRLPELEFFRTSRTGLADIVVECRLTGGLWPRLSTTVDLKGNAFLWREHLGALAGNFRVEFGDPILVQVSPLLAVSPHVVYTNLVEPLLRFALLRRRHMLLHAAVVTVGGRTIMLSARTDTGKTSTILRLLQDWGGTFFSDDMVLLGADGSVSRYPKPLTISAHTVHAMPRHRLGLGARLTLPLQSRLHSREGRAAGKRLGEMNLPIMAMNAAIQALVPPPKYLVTDLVPTQIGSRTSIDHIFLIERGVQDRVEEMTSEEALEELVRNTDDAYGFPPYSSLAPHIRLDGQGHEMLLQWEQAILRSGLGDQRATRIVTAGYGWAEVIEQLAGVGRSPAAKPAEREAALWP